MYRYNVLLHLTREKITPEVTLHRPQFTNTFRILLGSFSAFESYERVKHIFKYTFKNEILKTLLRRLYASVTYVCCISLTCTRTCWHGLCVRASCNLSVRGTHLSGGGRGGGGGGLSLITAIYRHGAHHHRMGAWIPCLGQ
jgi:hypothetical protein